MVIPSFRLFYAVAELALPALPAGLARLFAIIGKISWVAALLPLRTATLLLLTAMAMFATLLACFRSALGIICEATLLICHLDSP